METEFHGLKLTLEGDVRKFFNGRIDDDDDGFDYEEYFFRLAKSVLTIRTYELGKMIIDMKEYRKPHRRGLWPESPEETCRKMGRLTILVLEGKTLDEATEDEELGITTSWGVNKLIKRTQAWRNWTDFQAWVLSLPTATEMQ